MLEVIITITGFITLFAIFFIWGYIRDLEKSIEKKDAQLKELSFNNASLLGELNRLDKIFLMLDIDTNKILENYPYSAIDKD